MKLAFATLDVFSEKRFAGNPLAVVFDADKLDKIGATGIARRVSMSAQSDQVVVPLLRVKQDAASFPDMHFPTSQSLAAVKLDFTRQFFEMLGFPSSPDGISQAR